MLRMELLPAAHGDCIWVEYGSGSRLRRVLVDGGPAHTYAHLRERILHLPAGERRFELLVVTHIDADHIEGVVRLLQDATALGCRFERIWFNGREQLDAVPDAAGMVLGAAQGEYLSLLIGELEAAYGERLLNVGFNDGVVAVDRATGTLPQVMLPGGLSLTLLSPDHERLLDLKDRWSAELARAGLEPGDETSLRLRLEEARSLRPLGDVLGNDGEEEEDRFELPAADDADRDLALDDELGGERDFGEDTSAANGSSIALLAEFDGKAILLSGDAFPGVLETSIDTLLATRGGERLRLDAFKIPHHGSVANLTTSLLARIACRHYLVSTSGAVFRHPHERAVELLLAGHAHPRARAQLHFNYHTQTTQRWADRDDQEARRYGAHYPSGASLSL